MIEENIWTIPKWSILKEESLDVILGVLYEQIYNWTNRSLCSHSIMNEEKLIAYDALWGELLRWADSEYSELTEEYKKFIDTWSYRGEIYRIQDKQLIFRRDLDEPYLRRSGLKYHGKVASWSKSYRFDRFNHVNNSAEYLFIEGNTGVNYGFDVVKFCETINESSEILFRLRHEQEVIFPIDKKHVNFKEYMLCEEYINKKNDE